MVGCGAVPGWLRKLRCVPPLLRQPRQATRLLMAQRLHPQRGEANPSTARRTATGEARAVPPGENERLVDTFAIAEQLQLKVDPFHLVSAAGVGAVRVIVVDVRRRHLTEAPL